MLYRLMLLYLYVNRFNNGRLVPTYTIGQMDQFFYRNVAMNDYNYTTIQQLYNNMQV